MPDRFLDSSATGTGDGLSKANAYTSITNMPGFVAGEQLLVSHLHNQSVGSSSTTITFPGTSADPSIIRCIDFTNDAPASGWRLTSGTGANISFAGVYDMDSPDLRPGEGGTTSATVQFASSTGSRATVRNATIRLCLATGSRISTPAMGESVELINPKIIGLNANCVYPSNILVRNADAPWDASSQFPAALANGTLGSGLGLTAFDGCDLSMVGAGKVFVLGSTGSTSLLRLTRCLLSSAIGIGTYNNHSQQVDILNCSDTSGAIRHERHNMRGSQFRNASVYRAGGASEDGQALSWLIQTPSTLKRAMPFETMGYDFRVPAAMVGVPVTLTWFLLTDGLTLKNSDFWARAQALTTVGSRRATRLNNGVELSAAGANHPADASAVWTHGLASPSRQKMSLTFTPRVASGHFVRFLCALPSASIYIDPVPAVTAA